MSNVNNNNNNNQSVWDAVKQIGGGFATLWHLTGGKVVNDVVQVIKGSGSKLSNNDDFSNIANLHILERHVEKRKTYGEIRNLIILGEEMIGDEKVLVINLSEVYQVGEGGLKNKNLIKLLEEIVSYKGIKIKYDKDFALLKKTAQTLFPHLENYVEEKQCQFPAIREFRVACLSRNDLGQLSSDVENRIIHKKDISKLRMLGKFDLGEIKSLVIDEFELNFADQVNKNSWLAKIIFDARIFTSLKEIKIMNFRLKDQELRTVFEEGRIFGLNFIFWDRNPCHGLSKIKKIFLPKFIIEKFSALPGDLGDQSFICGLRGNGCSRVLDEKKNYRYIASSHTCTGLLIEQNEATGTITGNEKDVVEFIFE